MLTREMMDRQLDEHFAFEMRDDVEGVLSTLADDVEHDIVGNRPSGFEGRGRSLTFLLLHILNSPRMGGSLARTCGTIPPPSCASCRRTDGGRRRQRTGRPARPHPQGDLESRPPPARPR